MECIVCVGCTQNERGKLGMQKCMSFSVLFISLVSFSEARSRQGIPLMYFTLSTFLSVLLILDSWSLTLSLQKVHKISTSRNMNSLFSNPPQYTLFAPQILHKPLFSNAPGNTEFSQEHLKKKNYEKLGGGGEEGGTEHIKHSQQQERTISS